MCKYCDSKTIEHIIEVACDKAQDGNNTDIIGAWKFQKAVEDCGVFTFFDDCGQSNIVFGDGTLLYFASGKHYAFRDARATEYFKKRFNYCPVCGRKLD